VPPLSLGRGPRYGFEFCRHDTLSIYAAFEVKSGKLPCKTGKACRISQESGSAPRLLCRLLRSGFTSQKSNAGMIARGALTSTLGMAHN